MFYQVRNHEQTCVSCVSYFHIRKLIFFFESLKFYFGSGQHFSNPFTDPPHCILRQVTSSTIFVDDTKNHHRQVSFCRWNRKNKNRVGKLVVIVGYYSLNKVISLSKLDYKFKCHLLVDTAKHSIWSVLKLLTQVTFWNFLICLLNLISIRHAV